MKSAMLDTRHGNHPQVEVSLPHRGKKSLQKSKQSIRRKRCRDDSSTSTSSESEELSDLSQYSAIDDSTDDSIEESPSSDSVILRQSKALTTTLVDWAVPRVHEWISSARYITPPDYRIPISKRARTANDAPSQIFIELQDRNSSNISVLPIDGYFHLACPFFVLDPDQYEQCALGHNLRSISNVIQHLRKHHSPAHRYYCSYCGRPFDNGHARDDHVREFSCVRHAVKRENAVPRQVLQLICRKDDRRCREVPRWQHIYATIFPQEIQPSAEAVYLKGGLPLIISMVRDYWSSNGSRLVREFLKDSQESKGEELSMEEITMLCQLAGAEILRRITAKSRDSGLSESRQDAEEAWELVEGGS